MKNKKIFPKKKINKLKLFFDFLFVIGCILTVAMFLYPSYLRKKELEKLNQQQIEKIKLYNTKLMKLKIKIEEMKNATK